MRDVVYYPHYLVSLLCSQATAWFLYEHVNFFYDLVVDWSSPHTVPDIYEFVPYTWHINLLFKEFELLLHAHEFNWIDTSSTNSENSEYGGHFVFNYCTDCVSRGASDTVRG